MQSMEEFANDKFKATQMARFVSVLSRKHFGKGRKCW